MIRLRRQLIIATAAVWCFWTLAAFLGWNGWSSYPAQFPSVQFLAAALAQLSLWFGIVLAAGALFTHIFIVRDEELYEPADADGCDCADGCCAPDQSNSSS